MSVADWLKASPYPASTFSFDVTNLEETTYVPSSSELADLLAESYWGNDYLATIADRYGFDAVRDKFLLARAGARLQVRRGDFGEAVTADYLKVAEGYLVPVSKLRFKIGTDQTLPGTDCVALKVSGTDLAEVVFVESKLRTSLDLSVAVTGSQQLQQDANSATPEILTFMARQMRQANDPLTVSFEEYVFHRDTDLDRYLLVLLQESSTWDERILKNLEDEELDLTPLHVYVAAISDLKDLSDGAFSAMGAEVIEDDN